MPDNYIDRWTFFLNPLAVIIIHRMKYAQVLGSLMENSTKNGRRAKNHTNANLIYRQLFFIRRWIFYFKELAK